MTTSATAESVRQVLTPVLDSAGLFLEDVEIAAAGRRTIVRVIVDLPDGPGGVTSDQLGEISHHIGAQLDEDDVVPGSYTLEVTTPGVDRPLTEARHFRRNIGRLMTITTTDEQQVTGRLTDVDADALEISPKGPKGQSRTLELDEVTQAIVEVELRPDRT